MTQRFDAVIFDLDGTLADTLLPICRAGNAAMQAIGYPAIELPRYRYLAGQGLDRLLVDATGSEDPSLIKQGRIAFRAFYAEHGNALTRPYDGVLTMLDALAERQLPLAVLSNKPHDATVRCVAEVFGSERFASVWGHRDGYPLKPDPTSARELASELGIESSRCLYVGDTRVDMETSNNAGFFAVGVLWGFRDEQELREAGADAIIAEPTKLLDLL